MFDALALAGASAFVCSRDSAGLHIIDRTAEFTALINGLAGQLDEPQLLSDLEAGWPVSAESPFVVSAKSPPIWQCVLRDVGDGTYLAIFRVVDEGQEHNMTFFNVLQTLSTAVLRADRNLRTLYTNPSVDQIFGPRAAQNLIGRDHTELGLPDELVEAWSGAHRQVFDTGTLVALEFTFPAADGPRQYLCRFVPEFGADGRVDTVLAVAREVSEIKKLQRQLELLAQTDPLTGLLNRRSFVERLDAELTRTDLERTPLSVLVLDLDDFKAVNDTYGHVVGDVVLEAVGRILTESISESDLAARLGGDEFCVALLDAGPVDAPKVAERIRRRIVAIDHPKVSASIGVAWATAADRSAKDLITRVDGRMYRAKLTGKNHVDAGDR